MAGTKERQGTNIRTWMRWQGKGQLAGGKEGKGS